LLGIPIFETTNGFYDAFKGFHWTQNYFVISLKHPATGFNKRD